MIIDTHRHAYGKRTKEQMVGRGLVDPARGFPQVREPDVVMYESYWNTEMSVGVQRESGVQKAILGAGSQVETLARSVFQCETADAVRILFEDRLGLIEAYPDDFAAMVDADPFDDRCQPAVVEALDRMGARAISVATSYNLDGKRTFLDSPRCEWLWELAADKGVLVHAHPPLIPFGSEYLDTYRLLEAVGRPFDTALSISRMILSGIFDRYPKLQVVAVHMGGALPSVLGRLDFNWRLNYHGVPNAPAHKVLKNVHPPERYLRTNLFADTMGFSPTGIRQAIELFGVDRLFFGTDFGPLPFPPREHVDIVEAAVPDVAARERIFSKNAIERFRLEG